MKNIKNYYALLDEIQKEPILLVYSTSQGCPVCQADFFRIEKLCGEMSFPALCLKVEEVPEAAGQLTLFSLPAVILYDQGREYHRQARILDFIELEKRMKELKEKENGLYHKESKSI